MLLAIHIGNSAISLAVYETNRPQTTPAERLRFCAEIAARPIRSADEYAVLLGQIFAMRGMLPAAVTDVVISSVVPALTEVLRAAIAQFTQVRPLIVSSGIKTGLRIRIDNPSQLGSDLCAIAVGASVQIEGPAIIASLDTATTLTVLSAPDELAGVIIMPGLQSAAQALDRDAALLTEIPLEAPRRVIGKNTAYRYKLKAFFDTLKTGSDIGMKHPIMTLRNRLFENRLGVRSLSVQETLAAYIRVWNAYVRGNDLTVIRWNASEPIPEVL